MSKPDARRPRSFRALGLDPDRPRRARRWTGTFSGTGGWPTDTDDPGELPPLDLRGTVEGTIEVWLEAATYHARLGLEDLGALSVLSRDALPQAERAGGVRTGADAFDRQVAWLGPGHRLAALHPEDHDRLRAWVAGGLRIEAGIAGAPLGSDGEPSAVVRLDDLMHLVARIAATRHASPAAWLWLIHRSDRPDVSSHAFSECQAAFARSPTPLTHRLALWRLALARVGTVGAKEVLQSLAEELGEDETVRAALDEPLLLHLLPLVLAARRPAPVTALLEALAHHGSERALPVLAELTRVGPRFARAHAARAHAMVRARTVPEGRLALAPGDVGAVSLTDDEAPEADDPPPRVGWLARLLGR